MDNIFYFPCLFSGKAKDYAWQPPLASKVGDEEFELGLLGLILRSVKQSFIHTSRILITITLFLTLSNSRLFHQKKKFYNFS